MNIKYIDIRKLTYKICLEVMNEQLCHTMTGRIPKKAAPIYRFKHAKKEYELFPYFGPQIWVRDIADNGNGKFYMWTDNMHEDIIRDFF